MALSEYGDWNSANKLYQMTESYIYALSSLDTRLQCCELKQFIITEKYL